MFVIVIGYAKERGSEGLEPVYAGSSMTEAHEAMAKVAKKLPRFEVWENVRPSYRKNATQVLRMAEERKAAQKEATKEKAREKRETKVLKAAEAEEPEDEEPEGEWALEESDDGEPPPLATL